MSQVGEQVQFSRDCEVVQIPAGHRLTLPAGTEAILTQSLGGTYTLQVPKLGLLVRLSGSDAEAIGLATVPVPRPVAPAADAGDLERNVWEVLRTCYDPEIPVNIVDLGLVYDLRVSPTPSGAREVEVRMTLTAQGCGMGATIAADAQQKIEMLPGVEEARVEIVWDPPWSPQMISQEGREKLGIS
jgi:probable FeS assembly SUF system protein SufT